MRRWVDDIVTALTNLDGVASLTDIYQGVRQIRPFPHPKCLNAIVRVTIEAHSSDSAKYKGKDLFFSVKGLGSGVWGLRSFVTQTSKAVDIDESTDDDSEEGINHNDNSGDHQSSKRKEQTIYRILRDTKLACQIKFLNHHRCQLCDTLIVLKDGKKYSEAHHIKPLGRPHNGLDIASNIIVLCPNHHAMLDYGVIKLNSSDIQMNAGHTISEEFIKYHNKKIFDTSY